MICLFDYTEKSSAPIIETLLVILSRKRNRRLPFDDNGADNTDHSNTFTRIVCKLNWFRSRLDKENTRKYDVPEIISFIASSFVSRRWSSTMNGLEKIELENIRVAPLLKIVINNWGKRKTGFEFSIRETYVV